MTLLDKKLDFYRQCLIEWNYPNASIMDKDDIQKILFENRTNFLHWALTAYDPKNESTLEQYKQKQKLEIGLGNLIYENGCCLSNQKMDFINKKLKIEDDIVIFDRIFKLLTTEFEDVDTENIDSESEAIHTELRNPTDNLESKVFVKNNLFETNFKQLSDLERTQKLEKLSQETLEQNRKPSDKNLTKTDNCTENVTASTSSCLSSNISSQQEDLNKTAQKVENLISNFKETFSEYCAHFVKTPERTVNTNLDFEVKNCNENVNYLKKVLENKNFLKNLNAEVDEDKNNILSEYVTNNYRLLEDILYDEQDEDLTNTSDF